MRSLLTFLLLFCASACGGESEPKYSLKMVMLEIDINRQGIEEDLLGDDGLPAAKERALKIKEWLQNPAKDRFFESSNPRGTREQFDAFEAAFLPKLEAVLAAIDEGDLAAARSTFRAMEAGCNACHLTFRPDLPVR